MEIVQQAYALFERQDIEGILGLVAEDFELRLPDIYPDGPETFRGRDGMRRWLTMVQDIWDEWHFEVERLVDADEYVLALVRIVAAGSASGVPVQREVGHVWSVRGGTPSTATVYLDRAEAFRAVGLSN